MEPQFDIHLARGLLSGGEVVAARSCLERLEVRSELPARELAEQAHLRWIMKDIPAARRMIDRAVTAGADSPGEYHLQAMLLQFSGDVEEAGGILSACLRRWPLFGDAAL
ncbi:MAG: sulfotransferase family protein, partial [Rhodanobacter sp.]